MAYLIRYSLDLALLDTMAVREAIPLDGGGVVAGALPDFWEPVFAPRILFATGDRWLALTHGDSAAVHIEADGDPSVISIVRWASQATGVSDTDKDHAVQWTLEHALRDDREFAETWRRASRGFRRSQRRMQRDEWLRFSDRAPQVTALYGAGDCLFLTGFRPEDFVDGTSASILAVNLRSGEVALRRLLGHGETLRDIGTERVVTTFREPSAEWMIRVYEHGVDCRRHRSTVSGPVAKPPS